MRPSRRARRAWSFGPPGLVDDLQWVAIGLLIVVFLWFGPQGVLPERRRRMGASAPPKHIEIPNEDVVTLAGSVREPGLADAMGHDGSAVSVAGRPITRSVPSGAAPDEGVVLRAVDVTRDFGGVPAEESGRCWPWAELACMSALAKWLTRWQPIAIHSAVLAGARMEAIAGALGNSLQVAFDRWHEWASRQRDFVVNGKPGITEDEYEEVARRFAAVGIKP